MRHALPAIALVLAACGTPIPDDGADAGRPADAGPGEGEGIYWRCTTGAGTCENGVVGQDVVEGCVVDSVALGCGDPCGGAPQVFECSFSCENLGPCTLRDGDA